MRHCRLFSRVRMGAVFFTAALVFLSCALTPAVPPHTSFQVGGPSSLSEIDPFPPTARTGPFPAEPFQFPEVWAYLLAGEERFFSAGFPVSDVGYFGAGINAYGELVDVPRRALLAGYLGRVHLVIAETGNSALIHLCLSPSFGVRKGLVKAIAAAAGSFDGVQIDFEAVPARDYEFFFSFIRELKAAIGKKTLSVALPARLSDRGDLFGYSRIAGVADRVIIMAYDEHWSTSEPGSIASLGWCRSVAAYALSKIPAQKLVMGLPFYGRAWTDKSLARAYKFSSIQNLIEERGQVNRLRMEGIPYLEYSDTVSVRLFYEDAISLEARLKLYQDSSVRNIAFWRLGQEDPAVWMLLTPPLQVYAQKSLSRSY